MQVLSSCSTDFIDAAVSNFPAVCLVFIILEVEKVMDKNQIKVTEKMVCFSER